LSLEEQGSDGEEKAEQVEASDDKQWYGHVKREYVQAQKLPTLELPLMPPWPNPPAVNPIKLQKSNPMVHLPPPILCPKLTLPNVTFRGYGAPNFLAPHLNYDPRSFNFSRVSSNTMVPNSHKNYANLSQMTGLSRKQISNWSRTKIHKCQGNMPKKNSAPLSTIFTELSLSLEEQNCDGEEKAEQVEASEDKQWYGHIKREYAQAQKLPIPKLPLMPQIKLQNSNPMVHLPPPLAPHLNYDPRSFNFNRVSSNTIVPNSATPLSELKNWILQYSLNGINEVDDKRVEALSVTVCIADDEIICYLLHHGWYPKPAKTGMRYVRIGSAEF